MYLVPDEQELGGVTQESVHLLARPPTHPKGLRASS